MAGAGAGAALRLEALPRPALVRVGAALGARDLVALARASRGLRGGALDPRGVGGAPGRGPVGAGSSALGPREWAGTGSSGGPSLKPSRKLFRSFSAGERRSLAEWATAAEDCRSQAELATTVEAPGGPPPESGAPHGRPRHEAHHHLHRPDHFRLRETPAGVGEGGGSLARPQPPSGAPAEPGPFVRGGKLD